MKTYKKTGDDVPKIVTALLRKWYLVLAGIELRVDTIFVSTDGKGPALTHGGHPAAAVVRILDSKQRAMGRGDVEIVIDEAGWQDMGQAERNALIDYELYHVELKLDDDKKVKLDEHGRPKIKMRKHDHQFGWFEVIAHLHGRRGRNRGRGRIAQKNLAGTISR